MAMQLPPGVDLSTIPAAPPPPGVTPNLVDPPSLMGATVGIGALLAVLTSVLVVISLVEHRRNFKRGDYTTIIALVLSLAYTGVVIGLSKNAKHTWDIPISAFTISYVKLLYTSEMLMGPTIFFAKLSIFLLYLSIFQVKQTMRLAIYFGIFLNFAIYWPNVAINSYYDAPHYGEQWDVATIAARGRIAIAFSIVQGVMAVVIDLYIFVLPIPVLLGLQLQRRKKIRILAIFGTALLGITASVVALVFRVKIVIVPDQNWQFSQQFICAVVENYIAIIVSVMPACAGYFKTVHRKYSQSPSSMRSRLINVFSFDGRQEVTGTRRLGSSEFTSPSKERGISDERAKRQDLECDLEALRMEDLGHITRTVDIVQSEEHVSPGKITSEKDTIQV